VQFALVPLLPQQPAGQRARGLVVAQQPPTPPIGLANWSFDELTLANNAKFQGLILSETPDGNMLLDLRLFHPVRWRRRRRR